MIDQIAKLQAEIGMALHSMTFLIPDAKLEEGQILVKRIEQAVLDLGKIAEGENEQKD